MSTDLPRLRAEYGDTEFGPVDAGTDPMLTFERWFEQAVLGASIEPNAMSLGTVAADGTPSVRMVLLKGLDPTRASFTFYTNLDSRKSRELETGGRAALCWWWPLSTVAPGRQRVVGRQVRVVGRIELVDRTEAAAYFASRPPAARLGAAASPQSRAVASRTELLERAGALDAGTLGLPDGWGGWRVVADELEFWQGRSGRLHDRVAFLRLDPGGRPCSSAGADAAGRAALDTAGEVVEDRGGAAWLRTRLAP